MMTIVSSSIDRFDLEIPQLDEQTRCKYSLALRESNCSLLRWVGLNLTKYLFLVTLLAMTVWLALISEGVVLYFSLWCSGLLVGAFLRDFGWLLRMRRGWPLTVRVTNWELVKDIAEGKATISR